MTNREKFKEVFGFYPDMVSCVVPRKICKMQKGNGCDNCPFDDWWSKEYKECFELKEEYEQ
jgi:hypothetical protein